MKLESPVTTKRPDLNTIIMSHNERCGCYEVTYCCATPKEETKKKCNKHQCGRPQECYVCVETVCVECGFRPKLSNGSTAPLVCAGCRDSLDRLGYGEMGCGCFGVVDLDKFSYFQLRSFCLAPYGSRQANKPPSPLNTAECLEMQCQSCGKGFCAGCDSTAIDEMPERGVYCSTCADNGNMRAKRRRVASE